MDRYLIQKKPPRKPPKKTLNGFFHIQNYSMYGNLCSDFKQKTIKNALNSFSTIAYFSFSGFNSSEDVTMNARSQYSRSFFTSLEFDTSGEHVCSCMNNGNVFVHKFDALLFPRPDDHSKFALPFNSYSEGDKKFQTIRWHPHDPCKVAFIASNSNDLYSYDIVSSHFHTHKNNSDRNSFSSQSKKGMNDFMFFPKSNSMLATCSKNGNIQIWDLRSKNKKITTIHSNSNLNLNLNSNFYSNSMSKSIQCMQISHDEQLIFGGSESGYIHAWDLRKNKTSFFSNPNEKSYNLILSLNLAHLFKSVPSLEEQTSIANSSVHSILMDPNKMNSIAFHLNNNWSGCIDLFHFSLSHAHCPPTFSLNHERSDIWFQRRACFLNPYSIFCVPSYDPFIRFLDFSSNPNSHCNLKHLNTFFHDCIDFQIYCLKSHFTAKLLLELESNGMNGDSKIVQLEMMDTVTCLSSHPLGDYVVAGSKEPCSLILVSHDARKQNHGETS